MMSKRFLRDVRGTTAVEFALTAPAFFLLLFGGVQVGMALWTSSALQHGAEAAARCASITPSICDSPKSIQQFAANNSYGLNPPASAFTVSTCTASNGVPSSQGQDSQGQDSQGAEQAPGGPVDGYQVTARMEYFKSLGLPLGTYTTTATACFPK